MNKLSFLLLMVLSFSACAHRNSDVVASNGEQQVSVQESNSIPIWKRILQGLGRGMQGAGTGLSNAQRDQTNCLSQVVGNVVYTNCQ